MNEELKDCREAYDKWCKDNHLVDTIFESWAEPNTRSISWEAWQAAYSTRTTPIANNEGLVEEIKHLNWSWKNYNFTEISANNLFAKVPRMLEIINELSKAALQSEPKGDATKEYVDKVVEASEKEVNDYIDNVVIGATVYGTLENGQFVRLSKEEHDKLMQESKSNGIYEVTQVGDEKTPFNAIRVGLCDCNHPNCKTCNPKGGI